jgi:hypothetical protein
MKMKKDMLFLCIERVFELISGCRNLEIIFVDCRSNTRILGEVCNIEKIGEHLKKKRGLNLCYNCIRLGHIAKEPEVGPIFLCCKVIGHEVEDCPRIIDKVEGRDIRQENYEKSQETKGILESHKEKRSKEF